MLAPLVDLDRQAIERPDAIALATPTWTLTFAGLRAAVLAAAARLRSAGVASGDLVALDLPTGIEWVLDLALFRLAARSVSLRGVGSTAGLPIDHSFTAAEVDTSWFEGPADIPPPAEFDGPDAIFRYLLTSGTTGSPRAAAYPVRAFASRMSTGDAHWTDGRPELTLIGLSTTGGFHAAAACLRHGIPYLAVDTIDADSMALAARQGIRVLCGSPTQVAHALHVSLAAGLTLPTLEEVRLAGAGPSAKLLDLIAATWGVPVRGVYGSTEGGGVSQVWYEPGGDRADVGPPLPGVELEVVDGAVRYRTPGAVAGYLVDGQLQPLPGGWFVPGDRGRLTAEGSLVLEGRDSELLNLGGVKVDPARIDELAAGFPGVLDAAAFGIERHAGIPEVALAVVTDDACDLRELDRQLRERMPTGHPTAYIRVDAIPRSRLGKALRVRLAEDYARR